MSTSLSCLPWTPLFLKGFLLLASPLPAPSYSTGPVPIGGQWQPLQAPTPGAPWAQTHWRSLELGGLIKLYRSQDVPSYPKQQLTINPAQLRQYSRPSEALPTPHC